MRSLLKEKLQDTEFVMLPWLMDIPEMKHVEYREPENDGSEDSQSDAMVDSPAGDPLRLAECELYNAIKKALKFEKTNSLGPSLLTREKIEKMMTKKLTERYIVQQNSPESNTGQENTPLQSFLNWMNLNYLIGMNYMKRNSANGKFMDYDAWKTQMTNNYQASGTLLSGQEKPFFVGPYTGKPSRGIYQKKSGEYWIKGGNETTQAEKDIKTKEMKEKCDKMYDIIMRVQKLHKEQIQEALGKQDNVTADLIPERPGSANRSITPQSSDAEEQRPTVEDHGDEGPDTGEVEVGTPLQDEKQSLGNRLYPLIKEKQPELAGKITGMFLEGLEKWELTSLIHDQDALQAKITEAVAALEAHQARQQQQHIQQQMQQQHPHPQQYMQHMQQQQHIQQHMQQQQYMQYMQQQHPHQEHYPHPQHYPRPHM